MPTKEWETGVYGVKVECKCPVCEKRYKARMFWTGRGIPRLICDWCQHNVVAFAGELDDDYGKISGLARNEIGLSKDYKRSVRSY